MFRPDQADLTEATGTVASARVVLWACWTTAPVAMVPALFAVPWTTVPWTTVPWTTAADAIWEGKKFQRGRRLGELEYDTGHGTRILRVR